MPIKNKKSQKKRKYKPRKNVSSDGAMRLCEKNEAYADVLETRGSRQFTIETNDGKQYLATLKGTVAKQDIISIQDKVLVQIESTLPTGCVIVHKYNQSEKNELKKIEKSKVVQKDDDPFTIEDENEDEGIVGSDDDIDPDDI
jgi:translation initiation factor IF-1